MPPSLRPDLRLVRSLEDLPALVSALGARPAWQELATADWLDGWRPPEGVGRAALVGLQGGLPWFAVETAAPGAAAVESLAARLARRLRDRARPAAVVVLAPEARRLAVGAAADRAPTVALDLDDPEPLALSRLERARSSATGAGGVLAHAAALAAALDGEGVGRHFFERFRRTLERMSDGLEGGRLAAAERREVALLQLTRVLFLYFVQSKGWLAGDPAFLARQVDAGLARRRRLHRDLFRPLFFGTLDRPWAARGRGARAFGAVPFLNGGLFEPHPL